VGRVRAAFYTCTFFYVIYVPSTGTERGTVNVTWHEAPRLRSRLDSEVHEFAFKGARERSMFNYQ